MSRRSRLLTAVLAAAMLLFAQLAISAFACAKPADKPVTEAPCHHDTSDSPNLCAQHCAYSGASLGSTQASPSVPVLGAFAFAMPSPVIAPQPAAAALRPLPVEAHPPPLIVRFTVLRI